MVTANLNSPNLNLNKLGQSVSGIRTLYFVRGEPFKKKMTPDLINMLLEHSSGTSPNDKKHLFIVSKSSPVEPL